MYENDHQSVPLVGGLMGGQNLSLKGDKRLSPIRMEVIAHVEYLDDGEWKKIDGENYVRRDVYKWDSTASAYVATQPLADFAASVSLVIEMLGYDGDDASRVRWIVEREDIVRALRRVCADHGDNDWEPSSNLGDVVEKHLHRHLPRAS